MKEQPQRWPGTQVELVALTPIRLDGRHYAEGDELAASVSQAAELVALGAARCVVPAERPATEAPVRAKAAGKAAQR